MRACVHTYDGILAGRICTLADLMRSSSRLPPVHTTPQSLVRAICITSSGRTGIELTRQMDGKKVDDMSSPTAEGASLPLPLRNSVLQS